MASSKAPKSPARKSTPAPSPNGSCLPKVDKYIASSAPFAQNKAAATHFAAMPPGCRREYCEWIAEGKRRNWKYEACWQRNNKPPASHLSLTVSAC
jgi:hypothetical protein